MIGRLLRFVRVVPPTPLQLGVVSLGIFGVLAATCSAERQTSSSHGVNTPLGIDSGALPKLVNLSAGPGKLSLEEFTPLLALPSMQRAALALEAGNSALAAREAEMVLASAPPAPEDIVRWQFLLGRLREQAGDLAGAAASYDLASARDWSLLAYARLSAGRVLVRMGRHADALLRLKQVPLLEPLGEDTRLLVAEAAYHLGQTGVAIDHWRTLLSRPDPGLRDRHGVTLELAGALLEKSSRAPAPPAPAADQAKAAPLAPELSPDGDLVEALRLARRVRLEAIDGSALLERARLLERRALEALPAALRARFGALGSDEELVRANALLEAKKYSEAEFAADALIKAAGKAPADSVILCDAGTSRAKAIAGQKDWGRAADSFNDTLRYCKAEPERHARALFLAGKYAAADSRHMQAIKFFEELEKEVPGDRLADDARLRRAFSYYELGVEARFTELLSTMPEDYPDGDMVLEGVFGLALRRIEKNDWSGAASVLDRAATLVAGKDSARGHEFSGRERYFRARAWMQTGEKARGVAELETIVRELPLSYYMLHAYSRLVELEPFRAKRARDEALELASKDPFSFEQRPEFATPGFVRAMELLRQGEFEYAQREVTALGLTKEDRAPAVLWGVALLYARAGSAKLSHAVARGLLTDWLKRWPVGDWLKAWELAFPRPFRSMVQLEAKRNRIPESLAYAIMREESAFDAEVKSPADAYGLMQLILPTAREFGAPVGLPFDPASLKRPHVNIALGCRALGKLTQSFRSNPLLAIPAYNAGPGRPRRWLRDRPHVDFDVWVELIPFNETRRYTKRVLASRAVYAFLYESDSADETMALPLKLTL